MTIISLFTFKSKAIADNNNKNQEMKEKDQINKEVDTLEIFLSPFQFEYHFFERERWVVFPWMRRAAQRTDAARSAAAQQAKQNEHQAEKKILYCYYDMRKRRGENYKKLWWKFEQKGTVMNNFNQYGTKVMQLWAILINIKSHWNTIK